MFAFGENIDVLVATSANLESQMSKPTSEFSESNPIIQLPYERGRPSPMTGHAAELVSEHIPAQPHLPTPPSKQLPPPTKSMAPRVHDGTTPAVDPEDRFDTTDSAMRYAAYLGRAGKVVRYLAYASDVGEAFRPLAHPYFVTASYALSIGYVVGDVGNEAYWEYHVEKARGRKLAETVGERATFQLIASLIFPAVTIHQSVHLSKKFIFSRFHETNKRLFTMGPTAAGLCVIPFLPMVDEPVEHAVEMLFSTFRTSPKKGHHA